MYVADDNLSPFDIRRTIPPHSDPNIEDPPFAEKLYQQVNVMIFLLGDIKVGALYGDLKEWFPAIKPRVENDWPHHPDFPEALKTLILAECNAIETALRDTTGEVIFELLWVRPMETGMKDLLDSFRRLASDNQFGHCFCFPFLKFQLKERKNVGDVPYVPSEKMREHAKNMEDVTLLDLYTKARKDHKDLAKAVRTGIDAGILSDAGPGIATIMGGGGNNNRICDGGLSTCISHTGTWCNTDANGFCTVAGG